MMRNVKYWNLIVLFSEYEEYGVDEFGEFR